MALNHVVIGTIKEGQVFDKGIYGAYVEDADKKLIPLVMKNKDGELSIHYLRNTFLHDKLRLTGEKIEVSRPLIIPGTVGGKPIESDYGMLPVGSLIVEKIEPYFEDMRLKGDSVWKIRSAVEKYTNHWNCYQSFTNNVLAALKAARKQRVIGGEDSSWKTLAERYRRQVEESSARLVKEWARAELQKDTIKGLKREIIRLKRQNKGMNKQLEAALKK